MKIFKPEENLSSIIDLIKRAKQSVTLVSPFNSLQGWDELIRTINDAGKRIKVDYYVRKDEGTKGIEDLDLNYVEVFEVPLLHAKMFFSESEAIISSGNLTNRPDLNWVCGLDDSEYRQIVAFFKKNIQPDARKYIGNAKN